MRPAAIGTTWPRWILAGGLLLGFGSGCTTSANDGPSGDAACGGAATVGDDGSGIAAFREARRAWARRTVHVNRTSSASSMPVAVSFGAPTPVAEALSVAARFRVAVSSLAVGYPETGAYAFGHLPVRDQQGRSLSAAEVEQRYRADVQLQVDQATRLVDTTGGSSAAQQALRDARNRLADLDLNGVPVIGFSGSSAPSEAGRLADAHPEFDVMLMPARCGDPVVIPPAEAVSGVASRPTRESAPGPAGVPPQPPSPAG